LYRRKGINCIEVGEIHFNFEKFSQTLPSGLFLVALDVKESDKKTTVKPSKRIVIKLNGR